MCSTPTDHSLHLSYSSIQLQIKQLCTGIFDIKFIHITCVCDFIVQIITFLLLSVHNFVHHKSLGAADYGIGWLQIRNQLQEGIYIFNLLIIKYRLTEPKELPFMFQNNITKAIMHHCLFIYIF